MKMATKIPSTCVGSTVVVDVPWCIDVAACCGVVDSTYAVNSVLVMADPTQPHGTLCLATDGRSLSITRLESSTWPNAMKPMMLPREAWKDDSLPKMEKQYSGDDDDVVGFAVDRRMYLDELGAVRNPSGGHRTEIRYRTQDSPFPPVQSVMPQEAELLDREQYFAVAFNPERLARAMSAVHDLDSSHRPLILFHRGNTRPAVIIGSHGAALAMPVDFGVPAGPERDAKIAAAVERYGGIRKAVAGVGKKLAPVAVLPTDAEAKSSEQGPAAVQLPAAASTTADASATPAPQETAS